MHEVGASARSPFRSLEPWLWFALPLLLALVLHPGWVEGRGHPDENYHLRILTESISADTLAFPILKGKPWFTKPPLLIWLAAAIDALTAVGARAALRIVSLAGWALSYFFAFRLLSLSVPNVRRTSVQALAAVSGFGVLWFARIGMMDLPLLANLLAACWFAHRWEEREFDAASSFALAAVLALGGWWKGPVFYPLALLPMLVAIGRERIVPAVRAVIRTLPLWILVLAAGNFWILLNLYKYGWVYGRKFILGENLKRLHGLKPLRLTAYFLLGLFPFWVPLVQTLFRGPFFWLQQKSARIGIALSGATLLVFGYGADKHFHWFIPAFVGLGLVPWPEAVWSARSGSRFANVLLSLAVALLVLTFVGAARFSGVELEAPMDFALLAGAGILVAAAIRGLVGAWVLTWVLLVTVFLYQALPGSIRFEAPRGMTCEEAIPGPATGIEGTIVKFRGGLTPVGPELRALRENPGLDSLEALLTRITVRWRCTRIGE